MNRVLIVCVITAISTTSVLMGIHSGVKRLSQVGFMSGMFLMCVVFALDSHWFMLNLMCESFGVYVQWIMQIGWFNDAWGQLPFGEGKAMDSNGATNGWMDTWSIFYWGWWISWSAFVGIFLARISKNRTIANSINYTPFILRFRTDVETQSAPTPDGFLLKYVISNWGVHVLGAHHLCSDVLLHLRWSFDQDASTGRACA